MRDKGEGDKRHKDREERGTTWGDLHWCAAEKKITKTNLQFFLFITFERGERECVCVKSIPTPDCFPLFLFLSLLTRPPIGIPEKAAGNEVPCITHHAQYFFWRKLGNTVPAR